MPSEGVFLASAASEAAAYSLLYYDYILTLSQEIERYWKPRSYTLASALYFVNRYFALVGYGPAIYQTFKTVSQVQDTQVLSEDGKMLTYHAILIMLLQLFTAGLIMLRTYALYERNIIVLGIMSIQGGIGLGIGCWVISSLKGQMGNLVVTDKEGHLMAIAFSTLLLFDVTVFILTMWRAMHLRHQYREPLIERLFIDGVMYYGIILSLNFANILLLILAPPQLKGLIATSTNIISVVLISRLMLNLRDPQLATSATSDSYQLSAFTHSPRLSSTMVLEMSPQSAIASHLDIPTPSRRAQNGRDRAKKEKGMELEPLDSALQDARMSVLGSHPSSSSGG